MTFTRPFPLKAPAAHWPPSFPHISTLTCRRRPPPPSHPSASLLLNLETPPLSPAPSSRLLWLFFFSTATCHRSLSRFSLQTVDPLSSSLHRSKLPVPPDVCPSAEQLPPFFHFTKQSITQISNSDGMKWAQWHLTALPSGRFGVISK